MWSWILRGSLQMSCFAEEDSPGIPGSGRKLWVCSHAANHDTLITCQRLLKSFQLGKKVISGTVRLFQ